MIIKVDVKVAGDDEFMRCGYGSGKRKKSIKFIKKNRKRFGEGGRRRKTIYIEYRYFLNKVVSELQGGAVA